MIVHSNCSKIEATIFTHCSPPKAPLSACLACSQPKKFLCVYHLSLHNTVVAREVKPAASHYFAAAKNNCKLLPSCEGGRGWMFQILRLSNLSDLSWLGKLTCLLNLIFHKKLLWVVTLLELRHTINSNLEWKYPLFISLTIMVRALVFLWEQGRSYRESASHGFPMK